jgi:RNA polymerase sigma-70 factor (ECF subfamily)
MIDVSQATSEGKQLIDGQLVASTPNCNIHATPGSRRAAPDRLTDEELIDRFRNESAVPDYMYLNEMFGRYQTRIASWCLRFIKDPDRAVDLAQDVCLKAFTHLHTYRCESKVSTWLYAIARNHCLAFLRTQPAAFARVTEQVSDALGDANWTKAYNAIENEHACSVVRGLMLKTLDPLEAQVISLHYLQDVPLSTITQMLHLSNPSGAKAYVLRARRKLKWALRPRRAITGRLAGVRQKRRALECSRQQPA